MEIIHWIFTLLFLLMLFGAVCMIVVIFGGAFFLIVKDAVTKKQNDPSGERGLQIRDRYRKILYGKRYFDDRNT